MQTFPHPVCGHLKPLFAHRASGPCDWCLADIDRAYVQPPAYVKTWNDIRGERRVQLEATDWVDDSPSRIARADPSFVEALRAWRQALRDITSSSDDPANVTWPVAPSSAPPSPPKETDQ